MYFLKIIILIEFYVYAFTKFHFLLSISFQRIANGVNNTILTFNEDPITLLKKEIREVEEQEVEAIREVYAFINFL